MNRRRFLGLSAAGVAAGLANGCAGVAAKNDEKGGGHIATFSCDATPALGTPWYPSYKPLDTIEQPLQAKGVVLEDGGGRYVLCALDWCEFCNETHLKFRAELAKAAGTTPDRVAIQTVHQHTAPMAELEAFNLFREMGVDTPPPCPTDGQILEPLARMCAAVRESLGRMEAYDSIGTGTAKAERVASNRRVPIGDGKVGFRASSCRDPKLVEAPEGLIDPHVKTVTFARGGKPLARLHYYATHPQSYYWDPRSSIDFAGMAREWLQEEEGVFQVYFNGCGGNIAAGKYNNGTPEARQGLYERLRTAMKASADATVYTPAPGIIWRTVPVLFTPRGGEGFEAAGLEARMRNKDGAHNDRICAAMVLTWLKRAGKPIDLTSMQIGGVHVLHLPGEPAVEFQLYAQGQRPDHFVAVAGYGDCGPAYINPEKFTAEGGYEPGAAHAVPETETVFKAAIRSLLAV